MNIQEANGNRYVNRMMRKGKRYSRIQVATCPNCGVLKAIHRPTKRYGKPVQC